MLLTGKIGILAVAGMVLGFYPVQAQIDYRNLDEHRPVRTEDAYPVERYAFELLLPYSYHNEVGADAVHAIVPELSYGVLANTQVGIELPLAVLDQAAGTAWGLAGPRLFGLYNFNTEGPGWPALAARADLTVPLGSLGGDDAQVTLKAIATRSWGRTRLHLNGAVTVGNDAGRPVVEAEPAWALGAAGDYTLVRQSLLFVLELGVLQAASEAPTEISGAAGLRYQMTPTLVLDAGLSRRLVDDAGPDLGLTVGLSHAFGVPGLLPGRP